MAPERIRAVCTSLRVGSLLWCLNNE
jgi:hypothetical protein